ncbi:MAG: 30S ribosomal protein S9 [Bacteroidota bacterium]|nr:30S ribosomal protein S9 [Bacteroidota bacterium]
MENIHTVGRRKKSVARIYMSSGKGEIVINKKDYKDYFPIITYQKVINEAFIISENAEKYDIKATVHGGGVTGQAEAIRLAIARALVDADEENRDVLKKNGLLERDSRMVERKKPGQPKARKNFQFRKR